VRCSDAKRPKLEEEEKKKKGALAMKPVQVHVLFALDAAVHTDP
jgi:hypothetical protein